LGRRPVPSASPAAAEGAQPVQLSELLPVEAVRVGASAMDWRGAVRLAGDGLVASGATSAAYTDEMIATVQELGPYIVIAPGIALAHARPSPAVHHAGVSLVTLIEPVRFGHRTNDPVRLVVGLAAPDEEGHVTALATLAELLSDERRREALIAAPDAVTVTRMVRAFEISQVADAPSVGSAAETTGETP
jgi:PTS system ascorbate-specific IIA component